MDSHIQSTINKNLFCIINFTLMHIYFDMKFVVFSKLKIALELISSVVCFVILSIEICSFLCFVILSKEICSFSSTIVLLAETYLIQARKINKPLSGWPNADKQKDFAKIWFSFLFTFLHRKCVQE